MDFNSGDNIGRFTIVKEVEKSARGSRQYLCKCNLCGKEKVFKYGQLNSPNSIGCGCTPLNKKAMIGQKFGKLTVVRETEERAPDGSIKYECFCECGKIGIYNGRTLRNGTTTSCGCNVLRFGPDNPQWKGENGKEKRKKVNKPWKRRVIERENGCCEKCGVSEKEMHIHHKNAYHWCVNERYDVDNGACLCKKCHKLFHKIYGSVYNTEEQYIAFLIEEIDEHGEDKMRNMWN